MICHDYLMPALSSPSSSDYYALEQFALSIASFSDVLTTVSLTLSPDRSKIVHCYEVINDSKAWLSLWFSLAQFALFHFVMFSMSRIFFVGL